MSADNDGNNTRGEEVTHVLTWYKGPMETYTPVHWFKTDYLILVFTYKVEVRTGYFGNWVEQGIHKRYHPHKIASKSFDTSPSNLRKYNSVNWENRDTSFVIVVRVKCLWLRLCVSPVQWTGSGVWIFTLLGLKLKSGDPDVSTPKGSTVKR